MTGTRIHKIYCSMKNRCVNETKSSKYYKDKGITVCDEWLGQNGFVNFYNWAINNGYSDDLDSYNCSIDRIDNEKGYSPDNCYFHYNESIVLIKRPFEFTHSGSDLFLNKGLRKG